MPSTLVGSGKPMASNTVGAMSMQWVNWSRAAVSGRIRLGQATTIGSRAPPRWLAICLPHWNGALLACAHPLAKCGAANSSPKRHLIERTGDGAFHAGAVVTPDVEDQRVVG